jgi:RNA polymerase sigma-70 factor (ECF subfamily)
MDMVQQASADQDSLYAQIAEEFGPPLGRLAAAYELELSRQQDLLQELHFAIWRSLAGFRGQCTLRTWVYRVAHNAATTYVRQQQRSRRIQYASIEDLDDLADDSDIEQGAHVANILGRVRVLIERLKPVDRDVLLLHLEGLTAAEIGEVAGISAGYVSQKIHRVQKHLKQHFNDRR